MKRAVPLDENCPHCGSSMTLETDAEQPAEGWYA